jgi:excisionase family DNA binding protein
MNTATQFDEVLTLQEAAAFLKVSERMLYDRVSKRTIPYERAGRLIRFRRSRLEEWMKAGEASEC